MLLQQEYISNAFVTLLQQQQKFSSPSVDLIQGKAKNICDDVGGKMSKFGLGFEEKP